MAEEVEFQMIQLLNLAIGSPEVGAVNFNLLQKVLMELLKLTDLDSATIRLSASDAAKIGETSAAIPVAAIPIEDGAIVNSNSEEGRTPKKFGCGLSPEKADELLMDVNLLKMDVEDLKAKVETVAGATETVPFQEMRASVSKIDGLEEKMLNIEGLVDRLKDLDLGDQDMPLGQRLVQMQKLVELHEDQLTKVNNVLDEKLAFMTRQIEVLDREMGEINEKVNLTRLGTKNSLLTQESKISIGVMQDQAVSINNLISSLSSVQHDLDNLTLTANTLNEDSERKQMLIDVLTEQIEMLKLAKADKTNLEDSLAAKADVSVVHRKVSHDHFLTQIGQLTSLVEDAFSRLETHEESWQEEVDLLRTDLQNKLDKMEFSPLKDYVNEKLKVLQDKMKALAAQKREGLAAGSKRRVIRDVQCISCDNESVMKPENTFDEMTPPPPLPSQPSVRPYLAYKLDQVRKQQKKLPTGRNLLHFEEMLQNPADPRLRTLSRSGEHLVNRFVGGSHTITTPQQRITRTGNFFETWGPVITAVDTSQPLNV
ncbi:glutamine-rich protein 2-like [Macrosteles quadrilineatus]|uniref:glutamine-rich protein 2-like n=1 Tax=Macrosteles quadrilineatus TaxID=74068 RepID=UPI0023E31BB7|nr:glutamine-rich protein 2-like [Macrosteles quadrilineatus]